MANLEARFDALVQALNDKNNIDRDILAERIANPPPVPHVGGFKKVEPFTSGDAVEWQTWRQVFQITCEANGWNDLRRRQMLASSMSGQAQRSTADIAHNAAAQTLPLMLDLYQERFMPEAESEVARVQFGQSRQTESESVMEWHARVRALYLRAYPQQIAAAETSLQLIDQFKTGLANPLVRQFAWETRTATFTLALQAAHRKTASIDVMAVIGGVRIKKEPGLNAVAVDMANKTCWFCDKKGHLKQDCRAMKRIQGTKVQSPKTPSKPPVTGPQKFFKKRALHRQQAIKAMLDNGEYKQLAESEATDEEILAAVAEN
jgi:hypothetical protein